MRFLTRLISTMALLLTCYASLANDIDTYILQYTGSSENAIRNTVNKMLTVPTDGTNSLYLEDTELEKRDPHAYWLMNRMMQMKVSSVQSAEDAWAWVIAMSESVKQYNLRLGREAKAGSPKQAMLAITELIEPYTEGNSQQMNIASDIVTTLTLYKTLYNYFKFIDDIGKYSVEDRRIQDAYYKEFRTWFTMYSAADTLLSSYTYSCVFHQMAHTDKNDVRRSWLEARNRELNIEQSHYSTKDWMPVTALSTESMNWDFSTVLNFFKLVTLNDIAAKYAKYNETDIDVAKDQIGPKFGATAVVNAAASYDVAILMWRQTREQIAKSLVGKEQQASYREITKIVYTRLYNDLVSLRELKF